MTVRQSMIFYVFSTIKTVDDHCGYAFPWDPLQHITGNNAAYHDIHHQSWGIKTNFSQPYFTFWDRILGTIWKGDVKLRYEKARKAADEWWESQKNVAISEKKTDVKENGTPALAPSPIEDSSKIRRSPRKASKEAQLKGLRERVAKSNGMHNGVPRVDSNH
jgi:sphinganine C4-monooxygenase